MAKIINTLLVLCWGIVCDPMGEFYSDLLILCVDAVNEFEVGERRGAVVPVIAASRYGGVEVLFNIDALEVGLGGGVLVRGDERGEGGERRGARFFWRVEELENYFGFEGVMWSGMH